MNETTFILIFALFVLGLPILGIIGILICRRYLLKAHTKWMKSFAIKNDFTFMPTMLPEEKNSDCYFLYNKSYCKIFNYLRGNYKGRNIKIYNYRRVLHKGKIGGFFNFTILEFRSEANLPMAIITSRPNSLYESLNYNVNPSNTEKIKTESNEFNYYFNICIKGEKNENTLNVLEILPPDIMYSLIKEGKKLAIDNSSSYKQNNLSIETNNNTILLYKSHLIKDENELKGLLNLFLQLIEEVER